MRRVFTTVVAFCAKEVHTVGMNSIMFLMSAVLSAAVLSAQAEADAVDMKPLAMKAYGIRSVERRGDRALAVTIGASASQTACARADAWRVTSPDDPAYACAKFIRPASASVVSSKAEFSYPAGMSAPKKAMPPLSLTVVELKLPTPMKKNCRYAVVGYGAEMEVVTSGRTGLYAGEDAVDADLAAAIVGLRRAPSSRSAAASLPAPPATRRGSPSCWQWCHERCQGGCFLPCSTK